MSPVMLDVTPVRLASTSDCDTPFSRELIELSSPILTLEVMPTEFAPGTSEKTSSVKALPIMIVAEDRANADF